jgi:hypothetical protein
VVEDFFDFVARYCRYCPALILHVNPAVMDAVIECGTQLMRPPLVTLH